MSERDNEGPNHPFAKINQSKMHVGNSEGSSNAPVNAERRLLREIFEALTFFGEHKGCSARTIVSYVRRNTEDGKGWDRRKSRQVLKALQHAARVGLLNCSARKYRLVAPLNSEAASHDCQTKMKQSRRRRKDPKKTSRRTVASSSYKTSSRDGSISTDTSASYHSHHCGRRRKAATKNNHSKVRSESGDSQQSLSSKTSQSSITTGGTNTSQSRGSTSQTSRSGTDSSETGKSEAASKRRGGRTTRRRCVDHSSDSSEYSVDSEAPRPRRKPVARKVAARQSAVTCRGHRGRQRGGVRGRPGNKTRGEHHCCAYHCH